MSIIFSNIHYSKNVSSVIIIIALATKTKLNSSHDHLTLAMASSEKYLTSLSSSCVSLSSTGSISPLTKL